MIQLPEFLVHINKLLKNVGFISFRHASKNLKVKSGVKRIREVKVGDNGTKPNDVIEPRIRTKWVNEEHSFDKNEVDENWKVISQFITQIKEKFKRIDEKFDMLQVKFDHQLKEFQTIRKTSRRLTI